MLSLRVRSRHAQARVFATIDEIAPHPSGNSSSMPAFSFPRALWSVPCNGLWGHDMLLEIIETSGDTSGSPEDTTSPATTPTP